MKKILFSLLFVLFAVSNSVAQQGSCVVKNGDGASIVITITDWGTDYVMASFSTDCSYPVNVSFSFKVDTCNPDKQEWTGERYQKNHKSQPFAKTVSPNQSSAPEMFKINGINKGAEITEVKSVDVWGARCEK
ncbi:MAG: hypothetical protein IKL50_00110 [Bacteroidales bacterium]|nr:hypothetical protein [Bacteroidales bacterium]